MSQLMEIASGRQLPKCPVPTSDDSLVVVGMLAPQLTQAAPSSRSTCTAT